MIPAPVKPTIPPDILNQIDIRVGTIESVSDVPGSDKLVALRVNFGDQARTIVAGLKRERPNPREIEGRQALFVVKVRCQTWSRARCGAWFSEGILFDIGYADGVRPVLAVPESALPDGCRAG